MFSKLFHDLYSPFVYFNFLFQIKGSIPQVLPVGVLHPVLPGHPLLHPEVPLENMGGRKDQDARSGLFRLVTFVLV